MAKKVTKISKKAKIQKQSGMNSALIVAIVIAVGVIAVGGYAIFSSGGNGTGAAGSQSQSDINKYLTRFLPAGYQESSVSSPIDYTQQPSIEMADVKNNVSNGNLELSLNDIKQNKFVLTKYEKKQVSFNAGTTGLPVMAYIKPSGKLFVAVSFCPPCQGIKHTITPDGALTCNTCGTKRDLETQEGLSGACKLYPSDELPVKIQGDKVLISLQVLDDWSPQPGDRPPLSGPANGS